MEFPGFYLNLNNLVPNLMLNSNELGLDRGICCLDLLHLFNFNHLLLLDGLITLNEVDIVAGGVLLLLVAGRSVLFLGSQWLCYLKAGCLSALSIGVILENMQAGVEIFNSNWLHQGFYLMIDFIDVASKLINLQLFL